MITNKIICIVLLFFLTPTLTVVASPNTEQIRELSTQLQKMHIVDATRKNYSEPSDIARRKKMAEISAQIDKLQKEEINKIQSQVNVLEQNHVQLLENLKTCTRSSAKTITGTNYILGTANGFCKYRMNFGTSSHFLCNFPMAVAKQYAQESIYSIKNGIGSKFVEDANIKYCSMQNN